KILERNLYKRKEFAILNILICIEIMHLMVPELLVQWFQWLCNFVNHKNRSSGTNISGTIFGYLNPIQSGVAHVNQFYNCILDQWHSQKTSFISGKKQLTLFAIILLTLELVNKLRKANTNFWQTKIK